MSLTVCTVVSDPISMFFPFYEWLLAACKLTENSSFDRVFVVIGDTKKTVCDMYAAFLAGDFESSHCGESLFVMNQFFNNFPNYKEKVDFIIIPWKSTLYKWERAGMKNQAIKFADTDWVLFTDVDELIDDTGFEKIRELVSQPINDSFKYVAVAFGAFHYYRDMEHLVKEEIGWFKSKNLLFRNNLGMHFDSLGKSIDTLTGWDGGHIPSDKIIDATSVIKFHHVGHARPTKIYLQKTNMIEFDHHPWFDKNPWIKADKHEWNISGTYDIPPDWHFPEWVNIYKKRLEKLTIDSKTS